MGNISPGILLSNPYNNPMEVIYNTADNKLYTLPLWNMTGFLNLLRAVGYISGLVVILGLLTTFYFTRNPQELTERRKDIMHKFNIIFLIASLTTIFNVLKAVIDSVFF